MGQSLSASTNCGGGSLADVPADGYYCVGGDLNRFAGGTLPPGEYEVTWRYNALAAAPVAFDVLKTDGEKPGVPPKRSSLRFYHITPAFADTEPPAKAGEPFRWRECGLSSVSADNLAAALAVGPGGVYVPDLHTIPAADALVEARAEWRPYRDGDRVVVTLRAVAPHERVRFATLPQLHLQIEAPEERLKWAMEEAAKEAEKERGDVELVTPLTIEARLPADWRAASGASGRTRVAVLVTANRLELPRGGQLAEKVADRLDRVERADRDRPPVWRGVVRTDATERYFPLPLTIAKPAP